MRRTPHDARSLHHPHARTRRRQLNALGLSKRLIHRDDLAVGTTHLHPVRAEYLHGEDDHPAVGDARRLNDAHAIQCGAILRGE